MTIGKIGDVPRRQLIGLDKVGDLVMLKEVFDIVETEHTSKIANPAQLCAARQGFRMPSVWWRIRVGPVTWLPLSQFTGAELPAPANRRKPFTAVTVMPAP